MVRSVAYLVSRFPSVSQTFVLNEILELEALGWKVHLYPIIREVDSVTHPSAQEVTERANYRRITSLECVRAHVYWAKRRPATFLRILALSLTLPGLRPRFYAKSVLATLWATMIAAEIEAGGIRHVHAHWATFPAHAAMVISRLTGCTFSFTAHAHDIYANAYGLRAKISAATFVVTISELNRSILMQASGGAGQIKVIRCGVDLNRFSFRARRDNPSANLRVITVGSLEEKKGHRYLLEACALLKGQGRPVDCRIIGQGPERARLERLVDDLNLEDNVTFLGPRNTAEVAAELACADVFVMPSVVAANKMMEGIPVALMEAMATGLPVIASHISGIPELVDDGVSGILIYQRDAVAIASAITALGEDSELRTRLGTAAREVVAERYNLRKNAHQLADEFEATILRNQSTVE